MKALQVLSITTILIISSCSDTESASNEHKRNEKLTQNQINSGFLQAVKSGKLNKVKEYVNLGAAIEYKSKEDSKSPLEISSESKFDDISNYLIDSGNAQKSKQYDQSSFLNQYSLFLNNKIGEYDISNLISLLVNFNRDYKYLSENDQKKFKLLTQKSNQTKINDELSLIVLFYNHIEKSFYTLNEMSLNKNLSLDFFEIYSRESKHNINQFMNENNSHLYEIIKNFKMQPYIKSVVIKQLHLNFHVKSESSSRELDEYLSSLSISDLLNFNNNDKASLMEEMGLYMSNRNYLQSLSVGRQDENIDLIQKASIKQTQILVKILTNIYESNKGIAIIGQNLPSTVKQQHTYKYNMYGSVTQYLLGPGIYSCQGDCKLNIKGHFDMHPFSLLKGKFLKNKNRMSFFDISAHTIGNIYIDSSIHTDNKILNRPNKQSDGIIQISHNARYVHHRDCVNRYHNPFRGYGRCEEWRDVYYDHWVIDQHPTNGINGNKGYKGNEGGHTFISFKASKLIKGEILIIANGGVGGQGGDPGRRGANNMQDGFKGLGGDGGNGGILAIDLDGVYQESSHQFSLISFGGKGGSASAFGRDEKTLFSSQGENGRIGNPSSAYIAGRLSGSGLE